MNSMEMQVATKKRIASYSGGKGSYSSVAGNIFGNFQSIDASDSLQAIGIIGQGFLFVTTGDQDIRKTDILTINSVDYAVKGTRRSQNGSIDELECLMALMVTD